MEPREIGFTLGGRHCYRDMRCWAVWSRKTMAPKATRDAYAVGGVSGTVLLGGGAVYEEMDYKVTLARREPPRSEQEAQAWWREVVRWLRAGRQRLVLDSEPGRYYLAQVDSEITWRNDQWDEGVLELTMTLQPYSFAMDESSSSASFEAAGVLPLLVPSDDDVPIHVLITNAGTAALTGITVQLGADAVELTGLACLPGDDIDITMEPPIDALLHHAAGGDAESLIPYAVRFDPLAGRGAMQLDITPVFGAPEGGRVTVLARGRGVAV